jgi:hypothetical protein
VVGLCVDSVHFLQEEEAAPELEEGFACGGIGAAFEVVGGFFVDGVFDDEEAEFDWQAHEGVLGWWGGHFMGVWLCGCVCVLRAL